MTENICAIVSGTFVFLNTPNEVIIYRDHTIAIASNGTIYDIFSSHDNSEKSSTYANCPNKFSFPSTSWILPGMVDLHVHAPQYLQAGLALDLPLYEWLHHYTFPLESSFRDVTFARTAYTKFVRDTLKAGTTTAVCFPTIHKDSTKVLAVVCAEHNLRAVLGPIVMDLHDACPDDYRDDTAESAIAKTIECIDYIESHPQGGGTSRMRLLYPCITPRFVPCCSDTVLTQLGQLYAKISPTTKRCYIQTHCSESDWEHEYVLRRYGITDTEVLTQFGLIGRHTILAHCTHLTDNDLALLHQHNLGGIAHCPHSNFYFANRPFRYSSVHNHPIRVGLGSDVSGGPSLCMWNACTHAVTASKVQLSSSPINWKDALYAATVGGGEVLDLPLGKFEIGYFFDAVVYDVKEEIELESLWQQQQQGGGGGEETSLFTEHILCRLMHTCHRRKIVDVFVNG
eukprot:PhF_6_TR43338/c0_g1_i5/m.66318/K01487/E3.5.4.3, guaD; guanine deaminase